MANEHLRRTPTSTGNRRVGTISVWLKNNNPSAGGQTIFSSGYNTGTTDRDQIDMVINGGPTWQFEQYGYPTAGGSLTNYYSRNSSRFERDFSSWSHILVAFDTTQITAQDRAKIFINGIRIDDSTSSNNFARNYQFPIGALTNGLGIEIGNGVGAMQYGSSYYPGELCDYFYVDGQALTPDVFGFYKQGKGYISAGSTQATDFRPGQWVPKTPRVIKTEIIRRGGFGVNGFYLPMNDSNNFGADFHGEPNSIITLNEKLPQPRVGVATTASVGLGYTDALRVDPFAANLVLALPFVSSGLATDGTSSGTNRGFGDYSHIIRNGGSAKIGIITAPSSALSIASTAGYYGSAVSFNGNAGTGVSFASNSDFGFGTGDYTVECWVYKNSSSNTSESIWSVGQVNLLGALTLSYESSNIWVRSYGASDASYVNDILVPWAIPFPARQWNHIAVCRKGTTTTLFSNGVSVGVGTVNSPRNIATNPFVIGSLSPGGGYEFNGFIQDLRIYKGVAKYTGGFDVPRPYTPVGIATWRAVPDTTANNFATLNPLRTGGYATLNNGNLRSTGNTAVNSSPALSTFNVKSGKWYWELRADTVYSGGDPRWPSPGVTVLQSNWTPLDAENHINNYGVGVRGTSTGTASVIGISGKTTSSVTSTNLTAGDVYMCAMDADNGAIYFGLNGTWYNSGSPTSGSSKTGSLFNYTPSTDNYELSPTTINYNGSIGSSNFGQNPTFSGNTTAGTFTDSNSKGLFKYQPPSGFLALCEDNLPTPAIADPGKHFKTVLYTGDGNSGRSIVGVGFTPDLVWIKARSNAYSHKLYDSVRGFPLQLDSNSTGAEVSGYLNSANIDGFSLGSDAGVNGSGSTFVAWCWRAGAGTTSTNTNGSITSVVSVNQDAGFSIVSFGGNGSTGTVGHGLGKTPRMIIQKPRNASGSWAVYHASLGAGNAVWLNLTDASSSYPTVWNSTTPTSSVYSVGSYMGTSNYIAYCWAEIEGFSKFGSYVGNGNADGPFVYCGFRPAFVIIKRTDSTGSWVLKDSSRNSTNPADLSILAQASDTEYSSNSPIDFLSNGFKLRSTGLNDSGGTFIFAAWAESPFQTANSK